MFNVRHQSLPSVRLEGHQPMSTLIFHLSRDSRSSVKETLSMQAAMPPKDSYTNPQLVLMLHACTVPANFPLCTDVSS